MCWDKTQTHCDHRYWDRLRERKEERHGQNPQRSHHIYRTALAQTWILYADLRMHRRMQCAHTHYIIISCYEAFVESVSTETLLFIQVGYSANSTPGIKSFWLSLRVMFVELNVFSESLYPVNVPGVGSLKSVLSYNRIAINATCVEIALITHMGTHMQALFYCLRDTPKALYV